MGTREAVGEILAGVTAIDGAFATIILEAAWKMATRQLRSEFESDLFLFFAVSPRELTLDAEG